MKIASPPIAAKTTTTTGATPSGATRLSAQQLQAIPCPNLRTLVNEGYLTPDEHGIVDIAQLDKALQRIGVEGLPKTILTRGAETATKEAVAAQLGDMASGKFNILRLKGSSLDHPGDTRILRDGFSAERLNWLLSFAKDGRIGVAEMSVAQKEARTDEKTSLVDKGLGVAELVALVKVYGTKDATGRQSISVEGVRSLYEHARFPDEWKAQASAAGGVNPTKTGLMALVGGIVDMTFRQIGMTTGRARMGMDLSLGRDPQLNQTSAMGLAAAMCPAGPPAAMAKGQVDVAHKG